MVTSVGNIQGEENKTEKIEAKERTLENVVMATTLLPTQVESVVGNLK